MSLPIFKCITPISSENKTWEGEKYVSRTAYFLTNLTDKDGVTKQASVKISVNADEAASIKVDGLYTLAPHSYYEKGGKLALAPRLVPVAGAGGGTK